MDWKKIKGFKNYSINENGQVKNDITNQIKKPYLNKKNNYLYVDLWENNKSTKKTIHRLMAETFIPNTENKPTVDHKDGNRKNNSIDNLRWATYSEQNSRFKTIGLRSEQIHVIKYHEERKKRGGGHLSWGHIIEEKIFDSITDTAKYFDLSVGSISLLLKNGEIGKRGKTRGYKFEYLNSKRKFHNK